MTRAIYIKARKDYPKAGIKKGDMYYKWAFRFGGVHMSKDKPRPSQLTQSEFLSEALSIQEEIEDLTTGEILTGYDLSDITSRIEDLGSQQEDKLSNMPDGLQQGSTGELLQQRADAMASWADELNGVDTDIADDLDEEGKADRAEEILNEIQGIEPDLE
jgi:hypothetical protein